MEVVLNLVRQIGQGGWVIWSTRMKTTELHAGNMLCLAEGVEAEERRKTWKECVADDMCL